MIRVGQLRLTKQQKKKKKKKKTGFEGFEPRPPKHYQLSYLATFWEIKYFLTI